MSELTDLAADFRRAATDVEHEAQAVVERGAFNIKRAWRDNAIRSAGAHGKRYPYDIAYDTTSSGGITDASIGPDTASPQGGMSFEFGSRNQPPHMDGQKALDAEEPRFEQAMGDLVDKLL